MRVSIIGTGLQFKRRASVILNSKFDELVSISSENYKKAFDLSKLYNCEADINWEATVNRNDIDIVIVCTPPSLHSEISIAAMESGMHVLCEKPLSKTLIESAAMINKSLETNKTLKCGFNHRHHPAILQAKKNLDLGLIGRPLFARCIYGICGRPEYENEWRANPQLASGGQFIEQGSHAIDLIRWFMGEIVDVSCMTSKHYFKNQPLEDDGFAIFRTESRATASLHTSLMQWKNKFIFEIFGDEGYQTIEGLGGSYGDEKLYLGKKSLNSPFNEEVTYYRGSDVSWKNEWDEFISSINESRQPIGNCEDGHKAMQIAIAAYKANEERRVISLLE